MTFQALSSPEAPTSVDVDRNLIRDPSCTSTNNDEESSSASTLSEEAGARTLVGTNGSSSSNEVAIDAAESNYQEVISQELMKLAIVDRNAILEEVHGVRCLAVEETPRLIQASLKEFRNELNNDNPLATKKAYRLILRNRQRASKTNLDYNYAINDDDFRLRFIRCELFDVPKAVLRFCNYLDFAYEFWGAIALKRPIRLTDFSKAELKLFRKGFFQVLPFRDNSGRRIMAYTGGINSHFDFQSRNKIYFYLWDVITRDSVESQRKGFIMLRLLGDDNTTDKTIIDKKNNVKNSKDRANLFTIFYNVNKILKSIPSRITAIHVNVPNNPAFRLMSKIFLTQTLSGVNSDLIPRCVFGPGGTYMETRYRLKSYGIPSQLLPLTNTDTIKCTYHNQWIKTRKILERKEKEIGANQMGTKITSDPRETHEGAAAAADLLVECPALNDVVFRKGSRKTSIGHPGNRFFRELLRTFLEEKAKESEKLRQMEEMERHMEEMEPTEPTDHYGVALTDNVCAEEERAVVPESSVVGTECYPGNTVVASFTDPSNDPNPPLMIMLTPKKATTERAFCDWVVDCIESNCNGRFLEWNASIGGWVVITDKTKIVRKISITLYNWGKRTNTQRPAILPRQVSIPTPLSSALFHNNSDSAIFLSRDTVSCSDCVTSDNCNNSNCGSNKNGFDDNIDFRFINGGRMPPPQEQSLFSMLSPSNAANTFMAPSQPTRGLKRPWIGPSWDSIR